MKEITITAIEGILVGHSEDHKAKTGCTAIVAPSGVTASGHFPGFAPASRETDALRPENSVPRIHGLSLSGGSAFGLAAAQGLVRFLREKGLGFDTGYLRVPVVPAASIYDYPNNLSQGTLPDEAMGYAAAQNASPAPLAPGPRGAGLSAASGKLGDPALSSPSGLGSYGVETRSIQMAALAVVNPLGSVIDPENGYVISGLKNPDGSLATREGILQALANLPQAPGSPPKNTVLVAVATNAALDKPDLHRLAIMAATGIARTVYPANTPFDGDALFALATDTGPTANLAWLGALAAEVVAQAIISSVPA
ncbi:MAG: P1 family peptidase [Deltaproteobacteria bacterium]|jgi:L-aminopeptidase/D-esterase-like protein|nr:P1 family peptidase [Deltaproteobacteria bacterium]